VAYPFLPAIPKIKIYYSQEGDEEWKTLRVCILRDNTFAHDLFDGTFSTERAQTTAKWYSEK